VASVIGAGAFAMRSKGSNHTELPPQIAARPAGTDAVSPSPKPADAPAATLKEFNAAVVKGDESTISSLLVKYPGLANQRKDTGDTPLHFAADYNRASIAQRLIDGGADLNAVDNDGFTPLRIAAQQGYAEVASALIQKGADVNAHAGDKKGWTALHLAVDNGKAGMVKLLLDNGADVNIKGLDGRTPLAVARRDSKTKIIDLLTAGGATQ
jgi:cytohesin